MITDGNDASPMDDYNGWMPAPWPRVPEPPPSPLDIYKGALARANDPVAHPPHYARWKMEPIEFIAINNLPWWLCNVIKYTMRFDAKDGIKDLYKARSYLDMKIREVEGHEQFWDKPVNEERVLNATHGTEYPRGLPRDHEESSYPRITKDAFNNTVVQCVDPLCLEARHGQEPTT